MTKLNLCAGTVALLMLAACGSSGSDSDTPTPTPTNVTPQASTGFAVAGETDRANVTFTIRGAPSYDGTGNFSEIVANGGEYENDSGDEFPFTLDSFERGRQNVTIAFNDDESEATLTINGRSYTLARTIDPEEPDEIFYEYADSDAVVFLSINTIIDFDLGTDPEVVNIVTASELTDTQVTDVLDVFGFDTDPTVVEATAGSVTYTGNAFLFGTNINEAGPTDPTNPDAPSGGFDGIDGALTLTADFDDNNIGGAAIFDNDPDVGDPVLTETVTFENAAITGNSFSGSLTSDEAFFVDGVTFGDVTYDGNFYGADGENVAGAISGDLLVEGQDDVLMIGVFGGQADASNP